MVVMKSNFFALVLIYLCGPFIDSSVCFTVSYRDKRPLEGSALKFLDAALHHQVTKRQTSLTPEEKASCYGHVQDVTCSTGIAQGFVDAELRCGNVIEARRIANSCAKSERGEFCLSAFALFDLDGMERMNIEGNCSGVLLPTFVLQLAAIF